MPRVYKPQGIQSTNLYNMLKIVPGIYEVLNNISCDLIIVVSINYVIHSTEMEYSK